MLLIENYKDYKLSAKEKMVYYIFSSFSIFVITMLFFDTLSFSLGAVALCPLFQGVYKGYLADKRQRALRKEFVDFVYGLSAAAAVNISVKEALAEGRDNLLLVYGPSSNLASELGTILKKVECTNESEKILLYDLAERTGIEEIKSFFEIYYGCRESGGNLIDAVNRAGQIITDKMIVENDIKVFISQKKLESRMISIMPIGILGFLRLFSPAYLEPLYETNVGKILMLICLSVICFAYFKLEMMTNVAFKNSLEGEIPEVLNRISLLLSSGKVFSEVMEQIAREGENSDNSVLKIFTESFKNAESKKIPFIKELAARARETGSRELIRSVGIIACNIDKGSELSGRLDSEAEMLWHLCKKQVEERGKTAETKMSLPMGAMMLVLIIITTAPAFLTL